MYRIGILGTENSHAMAFTDIINGADSKYPDFKVTALYALEKAPSEAIAAKFDGIKIYDSPESMVDDVDCVMITSRHGKYHKPFAMPFIKAGKPAFIDKPFTISYEDALELAEAASKAGAPLSGGSGCKYSEELLEFKNEIESGSIGTVKSAVMTFAADLNSEYGGYYFYGAHLVEMLLTVFGYDPRTVAAFVKNGHLTAVVRYDSIDVVLSFAKSYTAAAYGDKGYVFKDITTNRIYNCEVEHFANMVRTGKQPLPTSALIKSVTLMNAIEKSFAENREIEIL